VRKSEKQGNRNSSRDVASVKDAPEKTKFRERLPDFEFAFRMKGTLPETVTAGDLEILNSALRILFADLRRAQQRFQEGEANGRAGATDALGAVWRFIILFEGPFSETLHTPILSLQDALRTLDRNNVLPLLKPVARRGRAKSSDTREALKGHVAGTVQRLLSTGLKPDAAHRRVAKELGKLGVRPERGSGDITATTVRHWCDDVAADVGRRGPAAFVYDGMLTDCERQKFSRLPKDRARSFAVASLRAFVEEHFPEPRSVKNPVNHPI
jgi:hypothetical protein